MSALETGIIPHILSKFDIAWSKISKVEPLTYTFDDGSLIEVYPGAASVRTRAGNTLINHCAEMPNGRFQDRNVADTFVEYNSDRNFVSRKKLLQNPRGITILSEYESNRRC